jgi:hypothetical protein
MSDYHSLRVPVFCPNCGGLMKGKSTNTFYDWTCCIDCYIFFLEDRPKAKEQWKGGWRPDKSEIERMVQTFRS